MKKLNHILRSIDVHHTGLLCLSCILGIINPWFFLLAGFLLIRYKKQMHLPILFTTLTIIFFTYYLRIMTQVPVKLDGKATITDKVSYTYYDRLTISYQMRNYHLTTSQTFEVGDVIEIKGQVEGYRKQTIPFGFDAYHYQLSQGTYGYIKNAEIVLTGHQSTFYTLRNTLENHLDGFESKVYLKAFLLGITEFDSETKDLFNNLNIYFLLTISGVHLYVLMQIIKKCFYWLDLPQSCQDICIIIIYLVICYVQGFSFGVTRLFVMHLLTHVNQKLKLRYQRIELLYICIMLLTIFNINWIYHLAYLPTLLILFFMYNCWHLYQAHHSYLKQVKISLLITSITLPFFKKISFISIVLMPVFIFIFSCVLFPLSILVVCLPFLDQLMADLMQVFIEFLGFIEPFQQTMKLLALTQFQMMLYLIILTFACCTITYKRFLKRLLILVLFFTIITTYRTYYHQVQVYFLDVGQGDSTVILSPSCNVVIDSFQYTNAFLDDQGINHLNYLFLTHSDLDHTKEAPTLIAKKRIDYLVLNPYDDYPLDFENIIYARAGDVLPCGKFSFEILNPLQDEKNSNDNSLVIQANLKNTMFLWMGDVGVEIEDNLINRYGQKLKSDVLKVGHHGSKHSTSLNFLAHVQPDVAIISAGYQNIYKFPNQEVLTNLTYFQVLIYRTDLDGTIIFQKNSKREKWFNH